MIMDSGSASVNAPERKKATGMGGYEQSLALFKRAAEVIPCGIYGHQSPAATLPGASPYYAARAKGSRYWDVDGREYIDFICAYGPMILGYQNPEVEEAAERQRREGDTMGHPTARMVELAERLVSLVDFAAWCVFGKNGGDMTSWAIRVARDSTRRKKVLRLSGGYHGIDPWCNPNPAGVIEEDREHVHTFDWNDLEGLSHLLRRFSGKVACVIITPFHHPSFGDMVLPNRDFLQGVERMCREEGVVLILDDIRAGFRLHLGGSHRFFGFTPDIICFSKALGNGYPISAALGRKELRVPASRVFLTGSFWNSAVPMAASLKVLDILERDDVPAKLRYLGQRLRDGLETIGIELGHEILGSGPEATPFYRFNHETNFRQWQRYCALVMEGDGHTGAFFHPHHNWFLSAAHSEADIDDALAIARTAMERFIEESA